MKGGVKDQDAIAPMDGPIENAVRQPVVSSLPKPGWRTERALDSHCGENCHGLVQATHEDERAYFHSNDGGVGEHERTLRVSSTCVDPGTRFPIQYSRSAQD